MKELYLLRHGDIGGSNRYIGATDLALSELGKRQINGVAASLSTVDFDAVYCSPMRRCVQTYELLNPGPSAAMSDDLREINFGRWEQKSFSEIAAKDTALVQDWVDDPDNFSFPEGESLAGFKERVVTFQKILYEADARRILIVTHGGIIRHLLCLLLHLPLSNYLLFKVATGSYSTVELYESGGILSGLNLR